MVEESLTSIYGLVIIIKIEKILMSFWKYCRINPKLFLPFDSTLAQGFNYGEIKMSIVQALSEEDTKFQYITPAIEKAGWAKDGIRMEYFFTDGKIIVHGNKVTRGQAKKADYILRKENIQLAIVEAKKCSKTVDAGLQQAMDYAKILKIPFAYSSNGKGFIEHDFFTGAEREIDIENFPTQDDLWQRYLLGNSLTDKSPVAILQPDYFNPFDNRKPRYYQRIAIDKTVEALSKGQRRILLVMATGTGKTFTAFQIVWKLMKSKTVSRVLYLADRNILIDQTMTQDFKPFSKIMCKVGNKHLNSAYEIFFSLYQQLAGDEGDEPFRQFKPEFFDLIIVDECHRGSAKADSEWRKILDYFNCAVHIGLTATPKETTEISNQKYFGEPVYTYSLKQGIEDGFLAPYKVIRINIDKDLDGWRPSQGMTDLNGNLIPDVLFTQSDFEKNLVIEERTKLIARRITKWLKDNGRYSKTIVFCVDIEHAERMRRALINENQDIVSEHPNYIMKITGDDDAGKKSLDYFIDPNENFPTVATTSELMTTGVDCKTCKLIVIDKAVNSPIIFKQMIGRGTRLFPEFDKNFFTIMDFRNATRQFSDPDFDGTPVVIIDTENGGNDTEETPAPPDEPPETPPTPPHQKFYVNGVEVNILNERVQYIGNDGRLITESLTAYSKKNILQRYATLNNFISAWTAADKTAAIIDELSENGVFIDELREVSGKSKDFFDDFDLILHIAYDKKPLTRQERAANVKKRGYLYKYSDVCQKVLDALLEKYQDGGISELENLQILRNAPFSNFGSPASIVKLFGGKNNYLQTISELKKLIYEAA